MGRRREAFVQYKYFIDKCIVLGIVPCDFSSFLKRKKPFLLKFFFLLSTNYIFLLETLENVKGEKNSHQWNSTTHTITTVDVYVCPSDALGSGLGYWEGGMNVNSRSAGAAG